MKIHRHLLALVAVLMTALSLCAQSLDDLTRQQARDLLKTSFNAVDDAALAEKIESQYGLPVSSMQCGISGDSVLIMSFVMPGYEADPTPAGRAYTEVCLSSGGRRMGRSMTEAVCALLGKAGYNVRVVYSDGGTKRQTLYLTPSRLKSIWTEPLPDSGIDPALAREGFIRSLGTADIPVEIESGGYFKSAKLKVNGNWLDVIYIPNADAGYYDDPALMQIYKEVLNEEKNQFISDMASDAFLRNYSDIMSNASEFLGVDGLKVKIMASDGEAYLMFPVTWDDMARLRQN